MRGRRKTEKGRRKRERRKINERKNCIHGRGEGEENQKGRVQKKK